VSVCCECCVLSSRGLCDGPIPRPEESYLVCMCVCVSLGEIKRRILPLYLKGVGSEVRLRKKEVKEGFPLLINFIFILLIFAVLCCNWLLACRK